ncbi:uncharacterized protein LOC141575980 [Camelus bactrianus]|uniref:Uncharacterized protein LOC141575980 n=1 Tax=Camelus bactrianus TaxID=9837 RepID=A0AC58PVN7_CAMBA
MAPTGPLHDSPALELKDTFPGMTEKGQTAKTDGCKDSSASRARAAGSGPRGGASPSAAAQRLRAVLTCSAQSAGCPAPRTPPRAGPPVARTPGKQPAPGRLRTASRPAMDAFGVRPCRSRVRLRRPALPPVPGARRPALPPVPVARRPLPVPGARRPVLPPVPTARPLPGNRLVCPPSWRARPDPLQQAGDVYHGSRAVRRFSGNFVRKKCT